MIACADFAAESEECMKKELRWKEKAKNVLCWRPGKWLVAVGAAVFLVLLLIPLLRMALYTAPWYDDYIYCKFVRNFLREEYSLKSALQGAVYSTRTQWYAWAGHFSSTFLMSLEPMVWAEELYFIGPMFLICILVVSVFVLSMVLCRSVLKADAGAAIPFSVIVAAMAVVLIYTAQQGFYWYNGGMHYVGMHSFLMLLVAAWIKLLTKPGKAASVFLVLWTLAGAVLAGGANFVTALQGLLLGISFLALGVLLRKKHTWLLLPSVLLNSYCFYKTVSAPGNNVRSAVFKAAGMGMDPLPAVGCSFIEAVRHVGEFSGLITLAVMVLVLPFLFQMLKKTEFQFRLPGLVLLWSFCLYATGFTPSLYTMGAAGLSRTLNAVKLTYQILLLINEAYWLGWLGRKLRQKDFLRVFEKGAPITFYIAVGLVMLGIFALESNQAGSYSSYGAYYWIHTGEANEFYKEYLDRVETIKNGGDVVTVKPYHFRPWFLSIGDLSADPDNEANQAMASWYGKAGIICVDETAE